VAWKPLSGPQWRYCAKVGIAAALAYALTRGADNQFGIYSALTAALIVGASFGEDLAASGSRVKGTLAGMIAGLAVSAFFGPSVMAVGLAVSGTALLALALGWGVPVARVGLTVCIITLVFHAQNALEYDLLRALNTVIGVAVGLAVSFFVWPVRARESIQRAVDETLAAVATLLDALPADEKDVRPALIALYDAIGALVKAGREAQVERNARLDSSPVDARALQVLQFGFEVLAAGLAAQGHAPAAAPVHILRDRLAELSHR
jgi:uncharacterized membrane protein YccC